MNSSKTVLDESGCPVHNTVQYNQVQYVFQHDAGKLFCCLGLISEWFLIPRDRWDVFQVCLSSPKLRHTFSADYQPKRQAKVHKKSNSSKKVPKIYSKKIVAAVCSQFSSKADLIHVVSRCKNSKIPACAACHPDLMCLEKELFRKFKFCALFNVLRQHNDSSDKQQNEKCKLLRNRPDAVWPSKF